MGSVCKEAELKRTEHSHRGRSHLSVHTVVRKFSSMRMMSPTKEKEAL